MFHSIYWGTNVRKLPCITTVEDKMTKGPQLVQLKYFIPLLGVWRCGIVRIGGAIVPAPGPVSGDIMEGQNHVISQGRSLYRAIHIQSLFYTPVRSPLLLTFAKPIHLLYDKIVFAFIFSTLSTNEKLSHKAV